MNSPYYYFRIDLGNKYGLGHYFRVKSFINHLKIKKYKIVLDRAPNIDFFSNEKKNFLSLYPIGTKFISEDIDAYKFVKITKCNLKNSVVVKDSYRLFYKWEKKISKNCNRLIAIDDFINNKHYVDYYINHSPQFIEKNGEDLSVLRSNNKKNTKFLLGPDFALFNSDYNTCKIKFSDLVFYNGGSGDPLVYEKIIKKLSKIRKYKIIIIVGPLIKKKKYQEILTKFKNYKNIIILNNLISILSILKNTKLFISSAGVAMFESSYLKIPTLLFKMVSNQSLKDNEYEKLGHYFILDKKDLKKTDKVVELIELMYSNRKKLRSLLKKNCINLEKIKKNFKSALKSKYG